MLELKRDRSINGEKSCPSCRHPLPEDAVVCICCGFNLETGVRMETRTARMKCKPPLKCLLGLLVIAAVGVVLFAQRDRLKGFLEKPPAAAPAEIVAAATGSPGSAPAESNLETSAETPASPDGDGTFTIADLLNAAEGYKESVAVALQRMRPLVQTNAAVDLRLINGQVKKGVLRAVAASNLLIQAGAQTETIALAKIDPNDRLRCDPRFRDRWVHFRSIAYARNEYTENGLAVPEARFADVAAGDAAIEMGEPAALIQAARRHVGGGAEENDLSAAFLYLSCAATQRDRQAQYLFGCLYCNGIGIGKNVTEGLRWISLAAAQGYAPAAAFLQKHQIDQQLIARSREEVQRRQEKERLEFAARLEEIRKRDAAKGADQTTFSGLRGPKKAGRALIERYPHWTDSRGRIYIYHPDGRVSIVAR